MEIGTDDLSSLATAIGVLAASYQLWQGRRQLRAGFERTFVERYEHIVRDIDLEVILDGAPVDFDDADVARALFHYFELCEEELYYRAHRRVSRATWRDWWYGIRSLLTNPAIRDAFDRMNERCGGNRYRHMTVAVTRLEAGLYDPPRQRLWDRVR